MRKLIRPFRSKRAPARSAAGEKQQDFKKPLEENPFLVPDLAVNLTRIEEIFQDCHDVVYREFLFAQREDIRLALIYIDGLVDKNQVSEQIMRALALDLPVAAPDAAVTKTSAYHLIKERGLCIHQVKETDRLDEVVEAVLAGDTVLLVDGHASAIVNGARGWEGRKIEDAETEVVVRGPRDSFVETLRNNTALLRRKIKSPDLKIEMLQLGRVTGTDIALVYLKGIVNGRLVEEVKERLRGIDIDAVLESGYIEELIQDNPWTLFPQINHTERPDRLAARLLEGRVGILVDGTPFALTVPSVLIENMQSAEDYYERFPAVVAIRLIRYLALILSLVAPSVYIAVVTFHHELLPSALLLSIAAQREAVPFPAFVEVLFMEISFEILREAGLRLPRQIGQAVSIVGALVVGDAAVRAGLVAPATVIVVALTGISSFILYYSVSLATRVLRFPLMALAAGLGLFGVMSGIIVIVVHLCDLRSFGTPYLSPLAPITPGDMRDTVFRSPWWAMSRRPRLIGWKNPEREGPGQKPAPPGDRSGVGGGEGSAGKG